MRQQILEPALQHAAAIDYVYDFGDNWRHRIKLEKTLPSDAQLLLHANHGLAPIWRSVTASADVCGRRQCDAT